MYRLRAKCFAMRVAGCLENSDLENSDLRPEKLRPSGCLENSDPKNSDPLGVSKTQTLWVSRKLRP